MVPTTTREMTVPTRSTTRAMSSPKPAPSQIIVVTQSTAAAASHARKRRKGISDVPATRGTSARSAPTQRAANTARPPRRSK